MKPLAAARALYYPLLAFLLMAAPALAQFRLVGGGQQVTQVTFDNPSGPLTSRFYVLESTSGASITFTATASTTSGGNWLSVKVYPSETTQGTTGNSVEIRVDPNIATGTYNGTVLFQQQGNPTVQLSIPVTFINGAGGGGSTTIQGFSTNPTTINLTYVPGSAAPTQNVTLSSNNGTQFTYSAFLTSGTNFVSVSSGGSGFGSFHNIGLTFNTASLIASTTPYTGNLQITIQGQSGAINIPISVTVSGSGGGTISGYSITPASINFNSSQTSQFVSIVPSNTSAAYFYSTSINNPSGNWLTVNPPSSSAVIAGTQGFTVTANPTGLQTGVTYTASIRVFVGSGQQDIPITFTPGTTGGGSISGFSVSPSSVSLSGTNTSQLVSINQTSGSSAYLFSTSVTTTNGGTWLSVNPTQSTSVVAGTQSFTVLINSAGLSAGTTYTGNVRLFINGQQQDIPVTYSPSGTGGGISGFTISPTLVNLSSTQTQQTVTVSPFNTGTVYSYSTSVTTTTGQQWLSVFPASSTSAIGAQSLTVLANPSGLTAGFTYNGTVRIVINGQIQDITVNYTPTSTGGGGTSIPGYTINPTNINLNSTQNQQAVTITPSTATPFVFTTSVFTNSGGSWLSVVPQSSTSATASLQSFTVIANVAGLNTGTTYTGTVRVFIGSGQQDITVNVTPGGSTGGGTISGYTVTPTTVNLSSGVTQQQVQIIPSNSAVAYSYTTSVTTSIGTGWLTVSPASSTAVTGGVQVFTIVGNGSGLTAGFTYTGSVRVFINGQYQDIAVNFTPSSSGGGSISGYTITPTVATLNATTPNQVVTISPVNTSAGYTYSLTSFTSTGQNWLSTTPTASTGTVFGSQAFTILTNATGLITGQLYTGTVRVIIGNQFQDITVNFTPGSTGGTTGFSLSPTSINFNVNQTSQLVSITPTGGTSTYSYTASPITNSGGSWLSVNPSSSSLTSGVTTFTVTANSSGLTTGVTYTGVVRVFVNSQQQDIQVTFTPGTTGGGGGGSGHVSPTSLSFNYAIGQGAPAAQSFFINTPSPAIFTATIQNYTVDFLRLSAVGGTTAPNLKIDAFIQPPSNLVAGTYSAQVLVKVGGYSDVIVTVTLTVTGSGGGGGGTVTGYNVSPTLLNFSYTPGGQLPFAQTVSLTSPSSVNYTLTYNNAVSNGVQWLFAAPASGGITSGSPASAIITVQANGASALPVGVYTAQILVQVGGTTVAQIPVTLTVGTVGTTTGFVAPSSLSFTHQIGTTNPTPQVLTIGTVGGATGSFTATATTNNGGGWLAVTPINGTAPGAVSVTVNPVNLTVGTYSGNVSVTFSGAGTTNIPVTFQVSSSAVLKLNLTSANFNYQLGGTVPSGQAQNIEVSSPGGSVGFTASATVNSGGNWLVVSPTSGATPATASIQINATGLPGGTYTGSVSFTAFGQQPVTIPVTLNISGVPLYNSVPNAINFVSAVQGITPSPQTISVSTTGATVPFIVSTTTTTGSTWLTATQTVPGTISVSANPAGLSDGTYFGAVTVTATSPGSAGNSPLVIPVTYQIGSGGGGTGGFTAQPTTMVFTQIQGGGVPPSQTLSLSSSGTQFNYSLAVSTNNGGSWLSATPVSGVTPGTINVTANAPSLPLGTYTGTIVATAPGALGSPQIVNVTLNVVTAPVVTASPNTLAFSSTAVGVAPAAQTVTLTSSGANLSYSASVSVGAGQPNWLEVTPTSGITPATLTVRANINGLAQGTYSGTVTVNLGLSTPISIPVTFNYGAVATPQILSMTNAASFLPTAAAPGLIVAIFGSNLGPTTLQQLRLTSNGLVDTNLNGVRVLFDNIPAPMVYARNDVLSAIVPYAMAGRASANVVVEYQGVRSAPLNVRVVDAAPGIFTTNQQGSGQGAILNNDFSLNGAGNPVARGQFATVYLTGEGQTSPAGVDGLISNANQLRNPVANVQVRVGDRNAQVIYAGSVPTTVLGLCQVSFFIPADAPTGNAVPLTVTIGGAATQTGVSIAVR
ncbi:MAG: hypothetical protein JST93_36820 [Acidobacteria bacterium]|nr:hypothetical protein [Acidobacteriota bacterium]